MLKRVSFQNFRCLVDVEIDLGPLTVLVGANASGKSSVLAGIAMDSPMNPRDVWVRSESRIASIALAFDGGAVLTKRLNPAFGEERSVSPPRPPSNPLAFSAQLLHLDLETLRAPNLLQEVRRIGSGGSDLTNFFATLSRDQQEQVVAQFTALVPIFSDVNARPRSNGHHRLVFTDRWHDNVEYDPHEVSDGTMLVLAFLLLAFQQPQVDLIAIEEPERGLHPYLLGQVVDALRRLARGELGPKVVLATHSSNLLDHLEPSEVRFLSRDPSTGAVSVETAQEDSANWKRAYEAYEGSLGHIWLSGGMGGVPGR